MKTIEERLNALEEKVLTLEGGDLVKEELRNPYESKSKKEAFVRV